MSLGTDGLSLTRFPCKAGGQSLLIFVPLTREGVLDGIADRAESNLHVDRVGCRIGQVCIESAEVEATLQNFSADCGYAGGSVSFSSKLRRRVNETHRYPVVGWAILRSHRYGLSIVFPQVQFAVFDAPRSLASQYVAFSFLICIDGKTTTPIEN